MIKENIITRKMSERLQGQIGIAALAVGMVPMILMMLLAGYWLQDSQLDAGLNAELNKNQKGFQAQIMLNQILESNLTRSEIRELPYADSRSDKEDEIRTVVRRYMPIGGDNFEYDFHINYPDHDDYNVSSSQVWMGSDHARANIASPEGDTVYVTLNIDGSVAQAYEPSGSTTPSTNRHPGYGDYH